MAAAYPAKAAESGCRISASAAANENLAQYYGEKNIVSGNGWPSSAGVAKAAMKAAAKSASTGGNM
jgi:hypothetical protein